MKDWKDCNGKALVGGARVRFIASDHQYGGTHTEFFFKNNIYGIVLPEAHHDNRCIASRCVLIAFTVKGMATQSHYQCLTSVVETIPEEEYEKYDRLLEAGAGVITKQLADTRAIMTLPKPTVNFNFRKFNFHDRHLLGTTTNNIELGFWDKSDGRNVFHVHQVVHGGVCCSFTKTTDDLQVYIPKIWLHYYGYLVYDLVEWLQFLSKCEIGFQYEFLGETPLSEGYEKTLPSPEQVEQMRKNDKANDLYEYMLLPGNCVSTITPIGKEGYYCIRMKASNNKFETYLRFICLRYIYNNQYWSIPGHAMQIKRELGEEVTHWQALLMAHLHYPYYYYYSFGLQRDRDERIPHERHADKTNPWAEANNYDRHLYPFQDVNVLLTRLRTGIGTNLSMEYICDAYTRKELNEFFAAKDYIGLYLYLREKEEKKDEKTWHLLQPLKERK